MIPLSVPNLAGNEWKYVKDCIDTNWISSVGSYVDLFEKSLAEFTNSKYAISTVNGTAALHISLLLSGVASNDYVILPNITFIASVNSIKYLNANPIFIDIDERSWQMDLTLLEDFLANNTRQVDGRCLLNENNKTIKAIMPVHVLGNMVNMSRLLEITNNYNLIVIEDATEALGSKFNNKHAGTYGTFGCFSFNGNKIISTGGGGMIVTDNETLAKKAKHITTQAKSDPFEYYHDEIGYNYRLVNILAAMGVAQMEQLQGFLTRKKEIFETYISAFNGLDGFKQQFIETDVVPNQWLQTFEFKNAKGLMEHLGLNKIQVRPFWVPLNQLPMFKNDLFISRYNISDNIYRKCVSLPCSTNLSNEEQQIVIDRVQQFYNS